MFCQNCGKENPNDANFCSGCGKSFKTTVIVSDNCFFIPKNSAAIWAYYLGLASVFFCLFSGIPALIMGIQGLKAAKAQPELKGEVHAWVGIICGILSVVFFILIILPSIIGLFRN